MSANISVLPSRWSDSLLAVEFQAGHHFHSEMESLCLLPASAAAGKSELVQISPLRPDPTPTPS